MNVFRLFCAIWMLVILAGCASNSIAPTPAPLPEVKNQIAISEKWHISLDDAAYTRLQPKLYGDVLAAISAEKEISLFDVNAGKKLWEADLPSAAAGGVGVGDEIIVAATLKGEVLAFDYAGKLRWKTALGVEVSAPPVVAGEYVLVRGVDGRLSAFSGLDGQLKWNYARQLPLLTLSNYAPAFVIDQQVYFGQAGGRLAVLSLADGRVKWEVQVAQSRGSSEIERMNDVVAEPVVGSGMVCAVAFQGRLACFNQKDGGLLWSREVSSWAGMAMDGKAIYVSSDKGVLSAYDLSAGRLLWTQDQLTARELSGPAIIGKTLLLGDFEGYLHFINTEDGSLLAQKSTDGGAIVAAPQVVNGHWIVQTQEGGLYILAPK